MLKQFTPASRPLRRWRLLQVRRRFEESGGTVREHVAAEGVTVHPDGVSLDVKDGAITARLLVDCMGNFGPIVRQVHRLPQEKKETNTQKQHVGCFPAHCQAGTPAPAGLRCGHDAASALPGGVPLCHGVRGDAATSMPATAPSGPVSSAY